MMERNREARRAAMVATNGGCGVAGFSRRRHRTGSSLRDSPEDDGPVELQETTARLRDRPLKKERDRLRERDMDRDRSGRSKRRRSDKFIGGGRGDDGVDDSSEESVNDEDDEDPDDGPVRYVPPNQVPMTSSSTTTASSLTNHHPIPRKVYPPPPNKVLRPVVPPWKADEMVGVSIPRKARSASTKRSHETWSSGAVGSGELIHRQASSSPVRSSVVSTQAASPSPAPMSPSSSNVSMKKKHKPNGQKQRPPKSYSKSSPSIQDEIEIEVAEVLYGLMRQSHGPAKQETATSDLIKVDSRETNNISIGDSKSRVSSPISNSPAVHPQPAPALPQNSSSLPAPLAAVAPKRKRPRAVGYDYEEENQSSLVVRSGQQNLNSDQVPKHDGTSPSYGKASAENRGAAYDLLSSQARTGNLVSQMESVKPEQSIIQPDSKAMMVGEPVRGDGASVKVEDAFVSMKELPGNHLDSSCIKDILRICEKENHREDKFEIDLMAPRAQLRVSREEGDGPTKYVGGGGGPDGAQKSVVADREAASRAKHPKAGGDKDDERVTLEVACGGADSVSKSNSEVRKPNNRPPPSSRAPAEEADPQKQINTGKDRSVVDLQVDLEKAAADKGPTHSGVVDVEKLNAQLSKQPRPQKITRDDANADKNGKSSSLQLQMSVAAAAAAAGWPGGLPPMGYVAPLQGVVSMDGTAIASAPAIQQPQFLFSHPRLKKCETHCYVARNIQCHQQFIKMNPFWPAAVASSAPLFAAAKAPYNLNVVPPADLHGNVAVRGINPVQDMGQALAFFPGQPGVKEKLPADASSAGDGAKKNHFLLQQSLPPGPPANLLHGPAFIFPLGQQQVAAAAANTSARPSLVKLASPPGSTGSNAATSTPVAAASTAPTVPPAMSFNFPSMPGNETQYLAILGNGAAYPFPIPAQVGSSPAYRGTHAQTMPFFNGSFYPPQILHPAQLQVQPSLQAHQNAGVSNAGASSHKHMQEQQQKSQGAPAGGGNLNPNLQPPQTLKNHAAAQPTQPEMVAEDRPSTADSRASRQNAGVYGPNFTLPIHLPNFFLTPVAHAAATSGTADNNEKQQEQQQSQQTPAKPGTESLAPPPFAMSFASMNGTFGLDISTLAQNHPVLQNLPEAARNNYQMMAAAAAAQSAQQKVVYRPSDGRAGAGDSSHGDEEKKYMAARGSVSGGHRQSLAFTRPELPEASASTMTGNNVVDSSARGLNLGSDPVRSSHPSAPSAISNASGSSSQQQQQMLQLQKQHQYATAAAAAATRGKTPTTGHGSVYPDQLSSSPSMAAKFPNSSSGFLPSHVQNSGGTSHSSQWKNSRLPSSQVSSSSVAVLTTAAMKNLPQQQSRPQQSHSQISFGANPKSTSISQAMQMPSSHHQAPSPPGMVGSPSTSSISKGASGSPRTTASTSTSNKVSGFTSHSGKNSSSVPSQKSSILGSPHILTSTAKPQLQKSPHRQQLLQQPQLSKQAIQQTQSYISNAYPQSSHNGNPSSAASTASGYYLQKHRQEQQQQQQVHKSRGSSPQTSSGVLSLSPVSLAGAVTTDPAKAVAAAASSMKGGVTSQGMLHSSQFSGQPPTTMHHLVSAGFPYVPSVPASATVTVKPAEQKQSAGNVWQPEEK